MKTEMTLVKRYNPFLREWMVIEDIPSINSYLILAIFITEEDADRYINSCLTA